MSAAIYDQISMAHCWLRPVFRRTYSVYISPLQKLYAVSLTWEFFSLVKELKIYNSCPGSLMYMNKPIHCTRTSTSFNPFKRLPSSVEHYWILQLQCRILLFYSTRPHNHSRILVCWNWANMVDITGTWNQYLHLVFIKLTISFLIGRKRTRNFLNQRL